MKTQTTIISAITIFTIAIAITAYARDPGRDARGDYGIGKNNYAMMGGSGSGSGMMGGSGSGSGMMHDYGHDEHNRYNRDTTDNYRRNHRGYMNDRDSTDHYRRSPGYDPYNRDTKDYDRWDPKNNRENDSNSKGDIESLKD
jgi:hypothetical protein